MSGYGDKSFADRSYDLGAHTFITKPIDYEDLYKKIEEVVSHVNS